VTQRILDKGGLRIFTHGDFDGIVSAALFISAFWQVDILHGGNVKGFPLDIHPVNYDINKWYDHPMPNDRYNVVLDYLYHPDADIWVDHHETGMTHFCEHNKTTE
jgi:hypothetical protein